MNSSTANNPMIGEVHDSAFIYPASTARDIVPEIAPSMIKENLSAVFCVSSAIL